MASEIKRARMDQKMPKIIQDSQIPQRGSEDLAALWRSVGGFWGLRISRIRRKEEKEEGGLESYIQGCANSPPQR
eukprot:12413836-Karenia_brevis.AAC.1